MKAVKYDTGNLILVRSVLWYWIIHWVLAYFLDLNLLVGVNQ